MHPGCLPFLFLLIAALAGCNPEQSGTGVPLRLNREDSLRARRTADSTADVQFSKRLIAFMNGLTDKSRLVMDTSWYGYYGPENIRDENSDIFRTQFQEAEDSVHFPFPDLPMSYHAGDYEHGQNQDHFRIRGHRIPETVYTGDNSFPVASIRRFRFGPGSFLVFNGRLQHYNGYGGRINFNYFFDLSGPKPVADMYDNSWFFVVQPFLYGTLNEDDDLDRVRFDGVARPTGMNYDTITIVAETYRNKKWQPLKDGRGMRYFIRLLVNAEESRMKMGAVHWIKPVPAFRP